VNVSQQRLARVSPSFAEKIMRELAETGHVLDPELMKLSWNKAQGVGSFLTTEMEIFLLALRLVEAPERPNINCIWQLNEYYGKLVSKGFISNFYVVKKTISISRFISEGKPCPLG
jgi:hypothetical protein